MLAHLQSALPGVQNWLGSAAEDDQLGHLYDVSMEYKYDDLSRATQGFSADTRLGAGAAGAVYKGTLAGGTEAAVKVLADNVFLGFEDEVKVLSRFRHLNIVTLMGWGQNRKGKANEKYLVYELLMGGDVEGRLSKAKKGDEKAFSWQQRMRVALHAACGLSFMVNSEPKAFHRDIKPANMLIDAHGNTKIADFGLASTVQDSKNAHVSVENIGGTPGYMCPVYTLTGRVTEQSEVYSFGVVLLELLMNQLPAAAGPEGDIIYPLIAHVQPGAPGSHQRIMAALDPKAAWQRPLSDQMAELALSCVDLRPDRRPPFASIAKALRYLCPDTSGAGGSMPAPRSGISHVPQSPPPKPNAPEVHAEPPPPPPGPPRTTASGQEERAGGQRSPAALRGAQHEPLAELVIECMQADGADLRAMAAGMCALAWAVDARGSRLVATVGRQHQPDFFDRVAKNKERASSISRGHFEISWEPGSSVPILRKLSGNPLLLDDRPIGSGDSHQAPDGTTLGFTGFSDQDPCFLVLRVTLRSRASVQAEGPHPAVRDPGRQPAATSMGPAPTLARSNGSGAGAGAIAAVLECVRAFGNDGLSALSPESRVVVLPGSEPVDMGRQHQMGFFEQLLCEGSKWLTYISRSHLRVWLSRTSPETPYTLRIENLSQNLVYVGGTAVRKGEDASMSEGGILAFAAATTRNGEETLFLEFMLRRARRQGESSSRQQV